MLRNSFILSKIKRLKFKKKFIEEQKIKKNGNNFPVNTDKLKDFKQKKDKSYPFFL